MKSEYHIWGKRKDMSRKKILTLALVSSLSLSALAAPLMSVEAAPSTVSEFDSLISELTSEENEISKKLEALQKDIKENEAEAEKLVAEMEETKATLEQLKTEIEALKLNIARREAHLAEQARGVQVMGETGNILNFVLSAETLDELVGKIDVVSRLVSSNKSTIEQQEKDKALVEEKEAKTLVKQEEQQKLAGKLDANKARLEERKAEEESMLARIASEKAVAKEERAELIARAEAAEARRQALEAARTVTVASATTTSNSANSANSGAVTTSSSSKSASKPAPAPAPSVSGGSVIGIANGLKGVPYSYGGGSTSGFDCSGFTSYVFARAGRSLPRTAAGQYSATRRVSRSQAQPGDLVFFAQGGGIDHVGIYLGGGNFIGSQSSTGVAVSTINSGYWSNYVVGFGR